MIFNFDKTKMETMGRDGTSYIESRKGKKAKPDGGTATKGL
jgi:hypothetical protein